MPKITCIEELYIYDRLLVYVGEDESSRKYLCLAIDDERYLAAQESDEVIEGFKHGLCDLREVFEYSKAIYLGKDGVFERYTEPIPPEWLPEKGFYLRKG